MLIPSILHLCLN